MLSCIWERRKFTSVLRRHSGSHAYGVGCYHYSVHKVSYDLQIRRSVAVRASAFNHLLSNGLRSVDIKQYEEHRIRQTTHSCMRSLLRRLPKIPCGALPPAADSTKRLLGAKLGLVSTNMVFVLVLNAAKM